MIDRDGLQVAYLGVALAHYLDVESGDIIDLPLEADPPGEPRQFRRIPTRTPESEEEDRRIFTQKLADSENRQRLAGLIHDPMAFRQALAEDRLIERSFFNFKNDRATQAIEEWIVDQGLE
jgi:hypothetical protein